LTLINLRSSREIQRMREAGSIVAGALALVGKMVKPGMTTGELDQAVETYYERRAVEPLFKGVPGNPPFPACICASVNEAVVHGIPDGRPLVEGDIVSVDTGCRIDGFCGDAAVTFGVGEVSAVLRSLLDTTQRALEIAIESLPRTKRWFAVAEKMATHVRGRGFSVVERFVGHGIGTDMHESPQVPNFVPRGAPKRGNFRIEPGLVLAIEPMVNVGTKDVIQLDDGWTQVTRDRQPSAHFEHTVAVVDGGVEVLTRSG
jgi:methionyl aminopeptidase